MIALAMVLGPSPYARTSIGGGWGIAATLRRGFAAPFRSNEAGTGRVIAGRGGHCALGADVAL